MALANIIGGQNINTAEASTAVENGDRYAKIAPGSIIGVIVAAEIHESKTKPGNYSLHISYDVAGPTPQNNDERLIGMYSDEFFKDKPYALPQHYLSLSSEAEFCKNQLARFFKSLEESNPGFVYQQFIARGGNEIELIGLEIGAIVGYEQYTKNNGEIGERLVIKQVCSVEAAETNTWEPKLKELKTSTTAAPAAAQATAAAYSDEDMPF